MNELILACIRAGATVWRADNSDDILIKMTGSNDVAVVYGEMLKAQKVDTLVLIMDAAGYTLMPVPTWQDGWWVIPIRTTTR